MLYRIPYRPPPLRHSRGSSVDKEPVGPKEPTGATPLTLQNGEVKRQCNDHSIFCQGYGKHHADDT